MGALDELRVWLEVAHELGRGLEHELLVVERLSCLHDANDGRLKRKGNQQGKQVAT